MKKVISKSEQSDLLITECMGMNLRTLGKSRSFFEVSLRTQEDRRRYKLGKIQPGRFPSAQLALDAYPGAQMPPQH